MITLPGTSVTLFLAGGFCLTDSILSLMPNVYQPSLRFRVDLHSKLNSTFCARVIDTQCVECKDSRGCQGHWMPVYPDACSGGVDYDLRKRASTNHLS